MAKDERGCYDIDFDVEKVLVDGGMLDEYFFLADLKHRKMYLDDDIDQTTVSPLVRHIMRFNCEDRGKAPDDRQPILLYISSNGGDVDAGFELIDVIQNSITPVYTINLGYQYSMAFLIGLAGHKRFAAKNAKFLMHDGSNFIYNSGAKAQDQMEFQRKVEERVRRYIISRSKLTEKEYDKKLRVEWYLFADEALEKGFTDHIIGVDCDIDCII